MLSEPTPELRRYRDPSRLWIVGLFSAASVGGCVVIGYHTSGSEWWFIVATFAFIGVLLARLLVSAKRAGVQETSDGLVARGGGPYRSDVAWRDIKSFGYLRLGARYVATAYKLDGSRKVLWGSSRTMLWDGGKTRNFAILLAERRRLFMQRERAQNSSSA